MPISELVLFEPCPKKLLRPELVLAVVGAGLVPLLERLRLLTPRDSELLDPLLKDDEELVDVIKGRRPLFDPPGTGGAGRDGVRAEPFHEAIVATDSSQIGGVALKDFVQVSASYVLLCPAGPSIQARVRG